MWEPVDDRALAPPPPQVMRQLSLTLFVPPPSIVLSHISFSFSLGYPVSLSVSQILAVSALSYFFSVCRTRSCLSHSWSLSHSLSLSRSLLLSLTLVDPPSPSLGIPLTCFLSPLLGRSHSVCSLSHTLSRSLIGSDAPLTIARCFPHSFSFLLLISSLSLIVSQALLSASAPASAPTSVSTDGKEGGSRSTFCMS